MSEQEPQNRKQRRKAERLKRKAATAARIKARRVSDDARRRRMSKLDEQSPLAPGVGDLVTGRKAQEELARLTLTRNRGASNGIGGSR